MMNEPSQLVVNKCSQAAALNNFTLRSHRARRHPALGKVIMGTARGLVPASGQFNPRQQPVIKWPSSANQLIKAVYRMEIRMTPGAAWGRLN
jgi:hypothetical protein